MLKSLLDRALKHVFNDNRYHTLSRIQIEAYTDLLAMAMVIDHHIAQQERDLITHHLEQFEWPESRPSEHFINQSVRYVRCARWRMSTHPAHAATRRQ